jgi:probable dihydroxyacetone kinase regulator
MSQTTKRALSASLMKLLSQRSLDKVTVVDIAEDCEVNRQTFYYHFKDIYDLVEWTFLNEATKLLEGRKNYDTWQEGFQLVLETLLSNKGFVLNIYHSMSREHLERYLYSGTFDLLFAVVQEKAEEISIREDEKRFIARFYMYGFVGLTLEWIDSGMKALPSELVSRLNRTISGDITAALERCRTDKQI